MKYYIKNKEININKKDFLGEGLETKVYKHDKYVLKIYKLFNHNNNIIYKLSNISLKRISKPINFIYNKHNEIVGYSSLYIPKNSKQANSSSTHNFLNNIKAIKNDFNTLNNNKIASNDCHIGNLIYDNYGNIYIIDIGSFYESIFNRQKDANKYSLIYITEELLLSDINNYEDFSVLKQYIRNNLYDRDLFDYLKKEVCKYHTINEYQNHLIKKLNR